MTHSLYRLDLTTLFCDIDDFYREYDRHSERPIKRLPYDGQAKPYRSETEKKCGVRFVPVRKAEKLIRQGF